MMLLPLSHSGQYEYNEKKILFVFQRKINHRIPPIRQIRDRNKIPFLYLLKQSCCLASISCLLNTNVCALGLNLTICTSVRGGILLDDAAGGNGGRLPVVLAATSDSGGLETLATADAEDLGSNPNKSASSSFRAPPSR
jgi:hypothetical protein